MIMLTDRVLIGIHGGGHLPLCGDGDSIRAGRCFGTEIVPRLIELHTGRARGRNISANTSIPQAGH